MAAKTKAEAVIELIYEAQQPIRTKAGLARINRAARVLGLTNGETQAVMERLDYCDAQGEMYPLKRPR